MVAVVSDEILVWEIGSLTAAGTSLFLLFLLMLLRFAIKYI
jgi:hypothetical protein